MEMLIIFIIELKDKCLKIDVKISKTMESLALVL